MARCDDPGGDLVLVSRACYQTLTSSITMGNTHRQSRLRYQLWTRQSQCLHYCGELQTHQPRVWLQNELYFHNDYNVALSSCQEKAHPSEDCEQPKTTLLSHPCYSFLSQDHYIRHSFQSKLNAFKKMELYLFI